ncbi:MAG TPA: patatin-like phospholipase family protein, partial [Moraxellaceae bacterium]
ASLSLALLLALSGCTSLTAPTNPALTRIDPDKGYRGLNQLQDMGDISVYLSFSGGGTRAAALSYGVLEELADTQVGSGEKRRRLLDEVDQISSVSGGSFTAAYYGLFGDQIFTDYENDFLRQSVQGTLIKRLLNPAYWYKSIFSGFDRTEMAIEFYDKQVFKGRTFNDMRPRPFITINASDISQGTRFAFNQEFFDLICSDVGPVKVAQAVTASSAVPVLFQTVVLKNHAGECDTSQSRVMPLLAQDRQRTLREAALVEGLNSYRDAQERPYIHLVDGGIADNLGLRAMLERVQLFGTRSLDTSNSPRHVVVILVDAAVKPRKPIDQTAEKPSVATTVGALADVQIARYTNETRALVQELLKELQEAERKRGNPTQFHLVEVRFSSEKREEVNRYLNSLPTSLELPNEEIDLLIAAGRSLLRDSPEFQDFLKSGDVLGKVVESRSSRKDKSCEGLDPLSCLLKKMRSEDRLWNRADEKAPPEAAK